MNTIRILFVISLIIPESRKSIRNPQILVRGKIIDEENSDIPQDIKKLFEDGINSLVDKLLKAND